MSHSLATSLLAYFWFQAIIHNVVCWCGSMTLPDCGYNEGKRSVPSSDKCLQGFSKILHITEVE